MTSFHGYKIMHQRAVGSFL